MTEFIICRWTFSCNNIEFDRPSSSCGERMLLIGRNPCRHTGHTRVTHTRVRFALASADLLWHFEPVILFQFELDQSDTFRNSYQECQANMFQSMQIKLVWVTSSKWTEYSGQQCSLSFCNAFFFFSLLFSI